MSEPQKAWGDRAGGAGTVAAPAQGARGVGMQPFGATERRDAWWLQPFSQALGLAVLGAYATWAAWQGRHFLYAEGGADYLSPFYSPLLQPKWWPLSPAFLILVFPGGFRATCYYYRKAYYRAFFADPMACAVGERVGEGYRGETRFPFILQNLHRYFVYAACVFLIFLWWDVIKAFTFTDPDGTKYLAIGGGSLAILASTSLLTLYTFSCHSIRHLVGGKLDCFSCAVAGGPRHQGWRGVTALNEHHMGFAWWSLLAVCFADFYVRMCSMHVFTDPRFATFRHLFDVSVKGFGP